MAAIYEKEKPDVYKINVEADMIKPWIYHRISNTYPLAYREFPHVAVVEHVTVNEGTPNEFTNSYSGYRKVDLVFLNPKNLRTFAYEFKMSDWKGVVSQAEVNLQNFSYSGIIMPYNFLNKKWDKLKKDVEGKKIAVIGMKEGEFYYTNYLFYWFKNHGTAIKKNDGIFNYESWLYQVPYVKRQKMGFIMDIKQERHGK